MHSRRCHLARALYRKHYEEPSSPLWTFGDLAPLTEAEVAQLEDESEELKHATVPTDLKRALMQARASKGLTQKALAQLVGCLSKALELERCAHRHHPVPQAATYFRWHS